MPLRPLPVTLAVLFLVALATGSAAQQPYLVRDINSTVSLEVSSSDPSQFLAVGGTVYFAATGGLWKHDGNGAVLIKNVTPTALFDFGGGVVLFTGLGDGGSELWRTDGTEAGTWLVRDIHASGSSLPGPGRVIGGKLLFSANDGVHGRELWSTDGTEAGTQLLVDLVAGASSSSPFSFRQVGDFVYFFASNGIWKTDGTAAGTTRIKALTSPTFPVWINGVYYFGSFEPDTGYEMWRSDLTEAGTAMITDLNAGTAGSFNSSTVRVAAAGDTAVFIADDGVQGRGLWRTDGTIGGTSFLMPIVPPFPNAQPPFLAGVGSQAFWLSGSWLWRTDGTAGGTGVLKSVSPNTFALFPAFSKLMFISDGVFWSSDGTAAGTAPLTGIRTGSVGVFTGGKLYFGGETPLSGREPWVCDSDTAASCRMLANIGADQPPSSYPQDLRASGGLVYFSARDVDFQEQIWRSDGTAGGTFRLTSFDANSGVQEVTPQNGSLFFQRGYNELWRSNGTAGGTQLLRTFGDGQTLNGFFGASTYLFINGGDSYSDATLWRSDGTPSGTISLRDQSKHWPLELDYPRFFGELAGRTCMFAGSSGLALWCSDGTVAGTKPVTPRMFDYSNVSAMVTAGGTMYFKAGSATAGAELWKTDGTTDGTMLVEDIVAGSGSSSPKQLTAVGDVLFFVANDGVHGDELWRSDGTVNGTSLVKDLTAGSASSTIASMTAVGGLLYFAFDDGVYGQELWKSDGSEAGTLLVQDIRLGPNGSSLSALAAADGLLWFAADDGTNGKELWRSDGSEGGTSMVADILAGTESSSPKELTPSARLLYFSAFTALGDELWAMPLDASSFSIDDVRVVEGHGGTAVARFTVRRGGSTTGAASVAYATADLTAAAGSDYTATGATLSFAAGETAKTFDVAVFGDTALEGNEAFAVVLGSPAGASLTRGRAIALIEDDDARADLTIEMLQNAGSAGRRQVRITNHGPSTATEVELRYSESPHVLKVIAGDVPCSETMPSLCAIGMLAPGATKTIQLTPATGGYSDPAKPPGRTVGASVTAAQVDPNPADNAVQRMMTPTGTLMLPPYLVTGQSVPVPLMTTHAVFFENVVTLTSANGAVSVSPSSVSVPNGERTGTFTLTGVETGASTLTLNGPTFPIGGESLTVPVAAPGTEPKLDVAIVAEGATVKYLRPGTIAVTIAAHRHDGTLPTGVVTLFDTDGLSYAQENLDGAASATFMLSGLAPGTHEFRVAYGGDANFHPLSGAPAQIRVEGWKTRTELRLPPLICESAEVVILVTNEETALAPEGVIELTVGTTVVATLPLTPGAGGQSRAQAERTFDVNQGYASARFVPSSASFLESSDGFHYLSRTCTPMNLTATAVSPTSVALSWTPIGAHRYEVLRMAGGSNLIVGSTTAPNYVDATVSADSAYLYTVRALDASGGEIAYATPDLATTVIFVDDPIVAGATVTKLAHVGQLRMAVAAVHRLATGQNAGFDLLAGLMPVRAEHVTDLRTMLAAARARLAIPPIAFTDEITRGTTIRAVHINELRAGVR